MLREDDRGAFDAMGSKRENPFSNKDDGYVETFVEEKLIPP